MKNLPYIRVSRHFLKSNGHPSRYATSKTTNVVVTLLKMKKQKGLWAEPASTRILVIRVSIYTSIQNRCPSIWTPQSGHFILSCDLLLISINVARSKHWAWVQFVDLQNQGILSHFVLGYCITHFTYFVSMTTFRCPKCPVVGIFHIPHSIDHPSYGPSSTRSGVHIPYEVPHSTRGLLVLYRIVIESIP